MRAPPRSRCITVVAEGAIAALLAALLAAPSTRRAGAQPRPERPPDLVLVGGRIFTADSARPWAQALAVRGDRVVAVGTSAAVRRLAGPTTRRIDLGGRVVVPGFNDAHAHLACDLPRRVEFSTAAAAGDPAFATVLDSLRRITARVPEGAWIATSIGNAVLDDTAARRTALDAVAPRHLVALGVPTGHDVVYNTAALRRLGVSDSARDPAGGWFERDPATGALTGRASEYALWDVARTLNDASPERTAIDALRTAGATLLRYGVTSVQDMANCLDPARTLRAFRAAALPLRVRVVPMPMTTATRSTTEWDAVRVDGGPAARLRVSGVKWILDGTPVDRGALQRGPYADRPGWYGRADFPPDTVRAMLAEARRRGEQPIFHAVGDSTVALLLTFMEQTGDTAGWRHLRVRFEHGEGLAPDLLERARRLGVVVVQNPAHLAIPGLSARYAPAVLADFQPLRSLLAHGVVLALGSDGPLNPFLNILLATEDRNNPAESLTREQAVVAYTRGSAYAEGAERVKGTLAPGMLADLAVLSQDIFTVPPGALPATTSVLTMVGGRVVRDALRPAPASPPRR